MGIEDPRDGSGHLLRVPDVQPLVRHVHVGVGAEGAGVDWPGGELSLLAVIAFIGASSFVLVRLLRRRLSPTPVEAPA